MRIKGRGQGAFDIRLRIPLERNEDIGLLFGCIDNYEKYYFVNNNIIYNTTLDKETIEKLEAQVPKYSAKKLSEIYRGYTLGIDISDYAKKYTTTALSMIMDCIVDKGIDLIEVCGDKYSSGQIVKIGYCLRSTNALLTEYCDESYTTEQMFVIYRGILEFVDVRLFCDSRFSAEQMGLIKSGLKCGFDVTKLTNPELTFDEMKQIYDNLCETRLTL